MQDYKRKFIEFAIENEVLRFGSFTLKSGRVSPYFFNAGLFNTGAAMTKLGQFYAQTARDSAIPFDMIFGPAYKGIPLAVAMASALSADGPDMPFAFNRKEAKDHGEGGSVVGSPLTGNVLIVDDVISAGTSVRESIDIINAAGATPAGVLISLDRQERGTGTQSAIQEVEERFGLPVAAIARLEDLIVFLKNDPARAEDLGRIEAYRAKYGA